jgi:PIN domain nuclease of toxin-antitoxin system
VRILLDTHVLIWWDEGARLSKSARSVIETADQVYVSAVSGWEIAVKASLGKLRPTRTVATALADSGFEELPLRLRHAEALARLPMLHRDPFDRMLVAQAISERLTLVSRDRALSAYDIPLISA